MRTPSLGTGACLVCLDVGAVYADILQVGVLAQFMEDLLDQAASDHSLNRLYTVCHGPYLSGRSRQAAPLRTIQKMPFSISLGSRLDALCRPSVALGNRAAAVPIRCLSVRTVELSASSGSPHE